MRNLLGRKLNRWAAYGAVFAAIMFNSAAVSMGWWSASIWAVVPMLGAGLGAGWLFGAKGERAVA